jgi:hypothetical protein
MSMYHVSFFKNLLSSDGHPVKCLQRRIDIIDAESAAQAAESASRTFEALYGCPVEAPCGFDRGQCGPLSTR